MIDWAMDKVVKPIILFLKGARENALRTWNLWIPKGTTQKNELKANQKEKKKSKKKKEKVKRAF